ncbi:MAG: hypothetical protein WAR57_07285 [Candidatus Phosphoribacter sp.]|nr:hypothetical protein [Actinomycetales bacterium]
MRTTKRIATLLAVAASAALSVAVASPASAATSSGCTVTPLKPIFAGFNSSGVKLVNYRISVSCTPNRTVSIDQQRYEEDDWPNGDDFLGSTAFSTSGVRTLSNVRTLVNGELGNEEVYHNVRFRVSSNGVTSPWTSYQKSAVLSILD